MIDRMPKTLTAFLELPPKLYYIYPKLHDMPPGSVGGRLKTMAWRLYEFPNPGEWSFLRHVKDSRYLAGFSDLADILTTTQ